MAAFVVTAFLAFFTQLIGFPSEEDTVLPSPKSIEWLNPFYWPGPATATAVLLVILATLGGFALYSGREKARDLGVALLSGSILALSVLFLQLLNENIAQEEQRRQERVAERRAFDLTVAVSRDLSGFDPGGRNLDEMVLSAKNFEWANFRNTSLKGAIIVDARLVDTDLSGADLYKAVLAYSNMKGATLRGAKFEDADLDHVRLKGAEVNNETCWPSREIIEENGLMSKLQPDKPGEIGHVCKKGEHKTAEAYSVGS